MVIELMWVRCEQAGKKLFSVSFQGSEENSKDNYAKSYRDAEIIVVTYMTPVLVGATMCIIDFNWGKPYYHSLQHGWICAYIKMELSGASKRKTKL